MPRFKKLLTQQDTVSTEEESEAPDYAAVLAARSNKASDIRSFNTAAVPLIFYNQTSWDEQEDSWVAECLMEWITPDDSTIDSMFGRLGDPSGSPSESDLGNFVDELYGKVNEWQNDKALATPAANPDFDADNPLPGTQYYKYGERWQGEGKQWLYAAEPSDDPAAWGTMQERYNEYEAAINAVQPAQPVSQEIIEPYGQGFMKAVEGAWRFGSRRDAVTWYADYNEMLAAEGLIAPAVAEAEEEQPEVVEAPPEPAHVAEIVAALDPATAEQMSEDAGTVVDETMRQANQIKDGDPEFAALDDAEIALLVAEAIGEFSKDLADSPVAV